MNAMPVANQKLARAQLRPLRVLAAVPTIQLAVVGILNQSRRKGGEMTDHLQPSAGCAAVIHLLDSAQGHPLQTWRFKNQDLITIGRGDGNDIVLSDPHVSRAHATVVYEGGAWTIVSIGRHGTLVNDRMVSEAKLAHRTTFRLGVEGPLLRLDTNLADSNSSQTMDNIGGDLLAMLEVDQGRKQREVDEIVGNALFQELKDQSRRLKRADEDTATD
jgi:FHA domain